MLSCIQSAKTLADFSSVSPTCGTVSCFLPVLVTCKTSVCVATQAEVGAPGVVVGVSVDGTQVWTEGFYTSIYSFIQLP